MDPQARLRAYDRHMSLSRAHATVAQAIKYPMLVSAEALRTARALIEASHVLDRQMATANRVPEQTTFKPSA